MSNEGKRSLFSSLLGPFSNRKHKESDDSAAIAARQRLEERIQQVLAERVPVPELLIEDNHAALMTQEEEAEPEVELLPISASVISIRKAPVSSSFLPSNFEVPRAYAANER